MSVPGQKRRSEAVPITSDLPQSTDVTFCAAFDRDGPATEVAERSFHFTTHQDCLQFAEAKLKNSIYARYFTKVPVCKKKDRIV